MMPALRVETKDVEIEEEEVFTPKSNVQFSTARNSPVKTFQQPNWLTS